MDSIIFHIDVNSAFLSWSAVRRLEQGDSLDLREIPSIIGGDIERRHGIVLAKSIPAKKFGIVTGEPVVSALKKCPNLVSEAPDMTYYREKSKLLMQHLKSICPVIEQVSVDECYMDYMPIQDCYESPEKAAHAIKDSVYEKFGFTVNIGISNRKVLAKMASDFRKPNMVHTLYDYEIREKMWGLPIDDLYMCGKRTSAILKNMGVFKIGELAKMDEIIVESNLKKNGLLLWNYANGRDESTVVPVREPVKSVGNSSTYSKDLETKEDARLELKKLCRQVSKRLQDSALLAGLVCVEIRYSNFANVSHQAQLYQPDNQEGVIYEMICRLFDELWNGEPIRLLGVRSGKLQDSDKPVQISLFEYAKVAQKQEKQKKLDAAIASINLRFGDGSVKRGSDISKLE